MELVTAMKIIRALHMGKSPDEEPIPVGSVCMRGDVQEALAMAVERLSWSINEKLREKSMPANSGKPWAPGEDVQLASAYDQCLSVSEIAVMHARTRWAIVKRLEHLGKIPSSEEAQRAA